MLSKNTRAHTHTHSQENDCGDECSPVESSSATVSGGCLFLVLLPTTVATAATACQQETDYRHQNDVQDANGCTHQEPHFIHQDLNTKHTHTHTQTCHETSLWFVVTSHTERHHQAVVHYCGESPRSERMKRVTSVDWDENTHGCFNVELSDYRPSGSLTEHKQK